ncbi:MAG: hypothetical protein Kow00108_18920 [Calditrichia bacterium]
MGVQDRKERERNYKRELILKSARHLFKEKGVENTSMEVIAANAEISKGALYLYFKNKEDIYWGVVYLSLQTLKSELQTEISLHDNEAAQLVGIGKRYYLFSETHPEDYYYVSHFTITGNLINKHPDEMAFHCTQLALELMQLIIHILEQGQKKQYFRSDFLPERMAFLLWGEITGVIQLINKLNRGKELIRFEPRELLHDHLSFQLKRIIHEKFMGHINHFLS